MATAMMMMMMMMVAMMTMMMMVMMMMMMMSLVRAGPCVHAHGCTYAFIGPISLEETINMRSNAPVSEYLYD